MAESTLTIAEYAALLGISCPGSSRSSNAEITDTSNPTNISLSSSSRIVMQRRGKFFCCEVITQPLYLVDSTPDSNTDAPSLEPLPNSCDAKAEEAPAHQVAPQTPLSMDNSNSSSKKPSALTSPQQSPAATGSSSSSSTSPPASNASNSSSNSSSAKSTAQSDTSAAAGSSVSPAATSAPPAPPHALLHHCSCPQLKQQQGRFLITTISHTRTCPRFKPRARAVAAARAPRASAASVTGTPAANTPAAARAPIATLVIAPSPNTAARPAGRQAISSSSSSIPPQLRPVPQVGAPVTYKTGRFRVREEVLQGPHWTDPQQPLRRMYAAATAAAERRQLELDSSRRQTAETADLSSRRNTQCSQQQESKKATIPSKSPAQQQQSQKPLQPQQQQPQQQVATGGGPVVECVAGKVTNKPKRWAWLRKLKLLKRSPMVPSSAASKAPQQPPQQAPQPKLASQLVKAIKDLLLKHKRSSSSSSKKAKQQQQQQQQQQGVTNTKAPVLHTVNVMAMPGRAC